MKGTASVTLRLRLLTAAAVAAAAASSPEDGVLVGDIRAVRLYTTPLSPRNHPLVRTKATRPPELQLFGRGSACSQLAHGCTGFSVQMYTSSDPRTGNIIGNTTAQLQSVATLANILSPSQLPLYAPNFANFAAAFVEMDFLVYGFMCDWAFRWLPGSGGFNPFPDFAAKCALSQDAASSANAARVVSLLGDRYLGSGIMESDLPGCVAQNSQLQYGLMAAPRDRLGQHLGFEDCTQGFRDNTPVSRHTNWRAVDMNIALMSHFYAGYGLNTAIGMEMSANGNMQTVYSWMRGAGRQYGVPYWADISEFTRFGYKRQDCKQAVNTSNPCKDHLCLSGMSGQSDGGTHCGTSYSLFKRAIMTCVLMDSAMCGFADELGCDSTSTGGYCEAVPSGEEGGHLSPIGLIQRGTKAWVGKHAGTLGVQISPVAMLLDYHQGWLRPSDVCESSDPGYQKNENVWGNIPYAEHDYFVLHSIDMLYPGYINGNLLRNESGIYAPTPFGDALDVLLTDVHEDVLRGYDTVLVGGLLADEPRETGRKLSMFVRQGGHLFITFDSLNALGADGISLGRNKKDGGEMVLSADVMAHCTNHKPGTMVTVHDGPHVSNLTELHSFITCSPSIPAGAKARTLASVGQAAVATELAVKSENGAGSVTGSVTIIAAAKHGISPDVLHARRNPCQRMKGLQDNQNPGYNAPRELVAHARWLLERALNKTKLFDLGTELAWVLKHVDAGQYIIGVQNPAAREMPLNIRSRIGPIKSIFEIPTDASVNASTPGWVPAGYEKLSLGANSATTIAGLELRVFRVHVAEESGATIQTDPLNRTDYANQPQRLLRIAHGVGNLQHYLIARPSFKTRFNGVVLDSAFVHTRTIQELEIVGSWLVQNNHTVVIDMSRVINVFPYPPRSFRMYKYMPAEYNASMSMFLDVVAKLPAIGSTDLILSLHQQPPTSPHVDEDIQETLRTICIAASKHKATVHLRQAHKNDNFFASDDAGAAALEYVKKIGVANLRIALQTGMLLENNRSAAEVAKTYAKGSAPEPNLLLVSGYNEGVQGATHGFSQAPVSGMDRADQAAVVRLVDAAAQAGATLIYDAAFASWNEALDDVWATSMSTLSNKLLA